MQVFNDIVQNKALFFSMISVIVATITFIGYLIYKERKANQEEIDDIMISLVSPKRKSTSELEEVEKDKEEMEEVKETIEPIKKAPEKLDLEQMLEQMQQDLYAKPEDVVEEFEKEQEENSIISYQELIGSIKDNQESTKIESTNEIVLENIIENEIVPHVQQLSIDDYLDEKIEIKDEEETALKKFKNTDFISPIYGKMEDRLKYPTVPSFRKEDDRIEKELETYEASSLTNKNIDDYLEDLDFVQNMEINSLEQTLNMKPLSAEVKENDEFLQALKEFRKNLD